MAKIGAKCALLNTNVSGESLIHSINIAMEGSTSRFLIADGELKSQVSKDTELFDENKISVCFWDDVTPAISKQPKSRLPKSGRAGITMNDCFIFIYTSGTTGLPKAAKVTHYKVILMALPMSKLSHLKPGMRVYNCLPLYHTAGGMMCLGKL